MGFRAFYSSTVPNDTVLHFNQTEYGQLVARRAQQLLVKYRAHLLYFNSETSGLTVTTEMIFDTEEKYREVMNLLYSEFADHSQRKADYNLKYNIEVEKTETVV
jgi:hypothetical protein